MKEALQRGSFERVSQHLAATHFFDKDTPVCVGLGGEADEITLQSADLRAVRSFCTNWRGSTGPSTTGADRSHSASYLLRHARGLGTQLKILSDGRKTNLLPPALPPNEE
jgi:hypothetical protein